MFETSVSNHSRSEKFTKIQHFSRCHLHRSLFPFRKRTGILYAFNRYDGTARCSILFLLRKFSTLQKKPPSFRKNKKKRKTGKANGIEFYQLQHLKCTSKTNSAANIIILSESNFFHVFASWRIWVEIWPTDDKIILYKLCMRDRFWTQPIFEICWQWYLFGNVFPTEPPSV